MKEATEHECVKCEGTLPPDFEKKAMEKMGYLGLIVLDDKDFPNGCNIHTHGFWESWKHPDIQIVIPMPKEIIGPIFGTAKEIATRGGQIITGRLYDNFLKGFNVEFAWAVECDRDILRIILPDKDGETARGKIAAPYDKQWEGTNEVVTQGRYIHEYYKLGEV